MHLRVFELRKSSAQDADGVSSWRSILFIMTLGPLAGGIMASHLGFRWPFVVVSLLLSLVVIPVIMSAKRG